MMRAEFYGGPLDGQVWEVQHSQLYIRVPVVEKPAKVWLSIWGLSKPPVFRNHQYELAVEYPHSLVYLSLDDPLTQLVRLMLVDHPGRRTLAFFHWSEGRLMHHLMATGTDWSAPGAGFHAVVEKIAETRRLKKSAKKFDPQ